MMPFRADGTDSAHQSPCALAILVISMSELQVVFGASGALGSAIVHHLHAEGAAIRAVARNTKRAADILPDGVEIMAGDATDPVAVAAMAKGAGVIYNCTYVAIAHMKEIAENLLTSARGSGATLVNPSNALVYGPLKHIPAKEDHPRHPTSRPGQVRQQIEDMLLAAEARGEAQIIIPRLSAFYGAHVVATYVAGVFESAEANRSAVWPGNLDAPHDLLYLPDAAAACVLLGRNPDAHGQAWHIPGAGPLSAREFITQVYRCYDIEPKMVTPGKTLFRLAAMVAPRAADQASVMYQYEQPFVLDGGKFAAAYPDFQYTPHDIGIPDTALWYQSAHIGAS